MNRQPEKAPRAFGLQRTDYAPSGSDADNFRVDIAIKDWRVTLNSNAGKLVISRAHREDLAHLTIAWGTASKELDIHLTYGHERAMRGDGPKAYYPLLCIKTEQLHAMGARLSDVLALDLEKFARLRYSKYRPGWLSRNGYVVQLTEQEAVSSWLTERVPKQRGKYRFDPERIFDEEEMHSRFAGDIYDPRVLNDVEPSVDVPVIATRVVRGKIAHADGLALRKLPYRDGWWGAKNKDALGLASRLVGLVGGWIRPHITPRHAELFELIVRGLDLSGDDEFVTSTRSFLDTKSISSKVSR